MLILSLLTACTVNDYWQLEDDLEVNANSGKLQASLSETVSQQNFVRYALDYEVFSSDSEETACVVKASSYVNGYERASHSEVIQLKSGESHQGYMTDSQLQLGNALDVSLQCCVSSRCSPKSVVCPNALNPLLSDPESQERITASINEVTLFCLESCQDLTECKKKCPTKAACTEYCANINGDCEEFCLESSSLTNCEIACAADRSQISTCIDNCETTQSCEHHCESIALTCLGNCVGVWGVCNDIRFYSDSTEFVPCSLCGGEGLCHYSEESDVFSLSDGTHSWDCETFDCENYSHACFEGCDAIFGKDVISMERADCLTHCLDQAIFWCSGIEHYSDAIDYSAQIPCCYSTNCANTLTGFVKTNAVECYTNKNCGNDQICNAQGICEASKLGSSCQQVGNLGYAYILFVLVAVFFNIKRRKRNNA